MAPSSYQGVPVPAEVAAAWRTWAGAEWRKQAWAAANNRFDYPDQRFGVAAPGGMCVFHLEMRRKYRDMYFDDRKGCRWPGTPVMEWSVIPTRDMFTERRVEWDDKAAEQMRLTEECCLSGRSSQCQGQPRTCTRCRRMTCACDEFSPFELDTSKAAR